MYHVNPKTGSAGKCKAEKGSCPFGGSDDHYTSEEAARASYERSQGGAFSSAKAAAVKRIPIPRTKSEFSTAILQVIPEVDESSVIPVPAMDVKGSSGVIRYVGGSVVNKDAQGNYKYQSLKEAIVGVRKSIAAARAAGEIPSWITTTVKNGTYHWTSPSLAITVGLKGAAGKTSIPSDWLDKSGDRPQSEAGVRLARYMEQLARQFETTHSNVAIDERNSSNRGKVEWL